MLFKSFIHKSARYETRFGQKMKAPISMEQKSKQDVLIGKRLSLNTHKKIFIRTTCKLKCRNKADYLLNTTQRRAVKKAEEDFLNFFVCVEMEFYMKTVIFLSVYCIAEHLFNFCSRVKCFCK